MQNLSRPLVLGIGAASAFIGSAVQVPMRDLYTRTRLAPRRFRLTAGAGAGLRAGIVIVRHRQAGRQDTGLGIEPKSDGAVPGRCGTSACGRGTATVPFDTHPPAPAIRMVAGAVLVDQRYWHDRPLTTLLAARSSVYIRNHECRPRDLKVVDPFRAINYPLAGGNRLMDNWDARTPRTHSPLNPGVGSTRAVRASMEGR